MTDKDRSVLRGFFFYRSLFEIVEELANDDTARLRFYDAVCRYVFKAEAPEFSDNALLRIAWRGIEPALDKSVENANNARKPRKPRDSKANDERNDSDSNANGEPKDKDKTYEDDKDEKNDKDSPPEGDGDPPSIFVFPEFWATYGKKVDLQKSRAEYAKIGEEDRAIIKAKLPAYVAATPDPAYRKNPLSWLRGRCWLDEDVPPAPRGDGRPTQSPPPEGPQWSDHEMGENVDDDELFM